MVCQTASICQGNQEKFVSHYYRCKHIMVRGNPAVLLWINHKAKKIWKKKYDSKEGKYKKAHKEAMAAYHKKHAVPFSSPKSQRERGQET